MATSEHNNAIYVEWKDPKKELPEANSYVLTAFSWSGCNEDYEVLFFDGENWHEQYGATITVLGWMYLPQLPDKLRKP